MSTTYRPNRRLLLLTALAAVLGLVGGAAAWLLLHLIGMITNLALFHRWVWALPSFRTLHASPGIVIIAVAGAAIVSMLAKASPIIRGHGIPEAMEAILTKQSRIAPRTAITKPISAAVAIGSGAPFGAEGPIIVTGGALGSLLGQVIKVSPAERKILLAAGAAAGMSATFGAPLAAVLLAIELLLFEFSRRAFIPLVTASAVAGGMHLAFIGNGALFEVPAHSSVGLRHLPLFAMLGLGAGLLAVVITQGLFLVEAGYRKLPVGEFWHPLIGAALFASVGLLMPRALGVGYDAIGDVLSDRLAVGTVAALAAVKLLAWWFALGSGTSGGTLAPILLISAGYGSLVGTAVQHLFPGTNLAPGLFAVVAMAATFGAATRATFTSIVFVFELTQDYKLILPLMLATVLAELLAGALMHESIMTEKLSRRGLRVLSSYEADPMRAHSVREIMTSSVATLPAGATVGEARRQFAVTRHGAYPVVAGDGVLVGIVARSDLLFADTHDSEPLLGLASSDVVTVAPDEPAINALHTMLEEDVEHVPVVSGGRLVGICTRSDLMRLRARRLDLERHQPGWRPAPRADPVPAE